MTNINVNHNINPDNKNIAGVVVLYNPDKNVINNITSYINQVAFLYVVDNSETPSDFIIDHFKNKNTSIEYIFNDKNLGIAAALNIGAAKSIEDGYLFLLTMDQDSSISDNFVKEMLKIFENDQNIGILSPFVEHKSNPKIPVISEPHPVQVAMTSGCIIRLSAYKKAGKFLEDFFIDYVDIEYCLRIQLAGYKILQVNKSIVKHSLGETEPRYFLFRKVYPTNHSPVRLYYRTRNRLFVHKKYKGAYPDYIWFDKKEFFKEILKIFLYEKNKLKKISMVIRGYIDFSKNKYGKYN